MKVALDLNSGEALEVALLEGDRVVGSLSLRINGLAGGASRGRASSAAKEATTATTTQRKPRRRMSAETKAKMAAAQKARWEKLRGEISNTQADSSDNQGEDQ